MFNSDVLTLKLLSEAEGETGTTKETTSIYHFIPLMTSQKIKNVPAIILYTWEKYLQVDPGNRPDQGDPEEMDRSDDYSKLPTLLLPILLQMCVLVV